jgi:GNAT superfamily N-acetyltransferase
LTPRGLLGAWIARDGLAIIGHVVLAAVDGADDPQFVRATKRPAEELAEVKRLFVAPASRRQGIARALLDTAVREARSRALHPVLETVADGQAALRCYEKYGWRLIGTGLAVWQRANGERPLVHQYELRD